MPRIGDEGQRYLMSAKRVSDGVRVDVFYFGPPADGGGIHPKTGEKIDDDPGKVYVASALKEMMRAFIILGVYRDPEIIDRRDGVSSKLHMGPLS